MTQTMNRPATYSQTSRVLFNITNEIILFGMFAGGASQFFRSENQIQTFEQLGLPLYLLSIIGLGKIFGAIVLCIPNLPPIFKIGSYVGLIFVTTGAVIAHIIQDEPVNALAPLVVAGIALVACRLNPSLKFAFQRPEFP